MQLKCHNCNNIITYSGNIGRRDSCDKCKQDLHCCKNCVFYTEKEYNNCKETQAERILDKENSNFCDFFKPNNYASNKSTQESSKDTVYKKLDDLFK